MRRKCISIHDRLRLLYVKTSPKRLGLPDRGLTASIQPDAGEFGKPTDISTDGSKGGMAKLMATVKGSKR